MAKDYAKPRNPNDNRQHRGGPASRRPPPPSPRGGNGAPQMPGWVWLIIGLAIGLVVAAFAYIDRPSHQTAIGSAVTPAATPSKDAKKTDTAAATKPGEPRKEDLPVPDKVPPRYTFYNELPKIEVTIPREYSRPPPANSSKPAPVPPAEVKKALDAPGAYLVQVGAYKSREEADKQRASLALIGYESRIEQVTLDERDTRFRVRVGPQPDLAAAQAVLAKLEGSNIKGFLVKIKD